MARGSGNRTVRIGIQTVSEDEQAFDAISRKVKDLERELRKVKDTGKEQVDEMKQGAEELDGSFVKLGDTISSTFLSLAAGVAGIVAIGDAVIEQTNRIRNEQADFQLTQTQVLIGSGYTGQQDVTDFQQQFSELRQSTVRTEQDLLGGFRDVSAVVGGPGQMDRVFDVLDRTETGAAALLNDPQSDALRSYVSRALRINPDADIDQLRQQGMALVSMGPRVVNQMDSIMEGAEQAATIGRRQGGAEGGISAFNEAIVAGAANARVEQGADVVRAALEGLNESQQMIQTPDGYTQQAAPAIASLISREGIAGGLRGVLTGRFNRDQLSQAGYQGIDFQEFDTVSRVYDETLEMFKKPVDLSGVPRALGTTARSMELDRRSREIDISLRDSASQGFLDDIKENQLAAEEANAKGALGLRNIGLKSIPLVGGPLVESGVLPDVGIAEIQGFVGAMFGSAMDRSPRNMFDEMRENSRRSPINRQPQSTRVDVQIEAPQNLNVQSEVN